MGSLCARWQRDMPKETILYGIRNICILVLSLITHVASPIKWTNDSQDADRNIELNAKTNPNWTQWNDDEKTAHKRLFIFAIGICAHICVWFFFQITTKLVLWEHSACNDCSMPIYGMGETHKKGSTSSSHKRSASSSKTFYAFYWDINQIML